MTVLNFNIFADKLHKMFSLKDLGDFHYFIGLEVKRNATRMYISLQKCILDILEKYGMPSASICPTPMVVGRQLLAINDKLM